jgi:hypothetical protein
MKNIMIMLVINLMSLGIIPMVLAQEQMGDFTLGIVEDPIIRGHEQTIVIASFGILPTNVTVTDTNSKNISFDTSADDYGVFKVTKGDFGEFYARFDIPGNSTPGTFSVTAEAPYDPEYKPTTKTFEVVSTS